VAVDLGPRPGGGVRSLFGQVDPAEFGLDRPAGYRAIGLVRQIGGSAEARRTAVVAGTARPGEPMQLDFGELRLPDGLHRLLAAIELLDDQPLADAATG
jgi:hypothetical protein